MFRQHLHFPATKQETLISAHKRRLVGTSCRMRGLHRAELCRLRHQAPSPAGLPSCSCGTTRALWHHWGSHGTPGGPMAPPGLHGTTEGPMAPPRVPRHHWGSHGTTRGPMAPPGLHGTTGGPMAPPGRSRCRCPGAGSAGRCSQRLCSTDPRAPLKALAPITSNYTRCIRRQTALNPAENRGRFQAQRSEPPQPHEKLMFLELLEQCLLMI